MRDLALVALGALLVAVPAFVVCARLAAVSRARRERAHALRAALEARLWEDSVDRADAKDTDPEETRRRRHEANNALSTALLSSQFLLAGSRDEAERAPLNADQQTAAVELVESLQRLKRMIAETRSATTTGPRAPLVSPTELLAGVLASAEKARARRPGVAIQVALASPALERTRVAVCAGADGLARALDALLANACEGDGSRAASRVDVRVGAEGEVDVVSLEIADDGPGFAPESLAIRPPAFASTKPGSLGLGLYTAERILVASGGSLRRENAPNGGARITVFLLRAQ